MPTHDLDTGATKAGRTLLRDAVVARVAALTVASGLYLTAVVAIPVPFRDDDVLERMLTDFAGGRSPMAMVALGAGTFRAAGVGHADEWTEEVDVHVYLLSSHTGGTLYRMTGDASSLVALTKDPGIEIAAEHVRERLAGWRPTATGLLAKELRIVSQDAIYFGEDYTIWHQVYAVQCRADVDRLRGLTQLLTGVDATHGIDDGPDGAEVSTIASETDIEA